MMTVLTRLSTRWNRWRRARALRRIHKLQRFADPLGTLRQFLYLDTIALRSLYVSRFGPEDARTTITDARSREAEVNASIGHTMPGVANLNAGARMRSTTSSTMQVERVASEQSLFRDFLERESIADSRSALWNGVPDAKGVLPENVPELKRGRLIQVRIRLQADPTFGLSSFANAIADLAHDAPEAAAGFRDAEDIGPLLRHLLIDQAPIDSELVDWGWDSAAAKVARRTDVTQPLRLAALTDTANYWLDVRRTLFDEAECHALVRVAHDVPSSDWSPVKLFDAVKSIAGFGVIDGAIGQLRTIVGQGIPAKPSSEQPLCAALLRYAAARTTNSVPQIVSDAIPAIAAAHAGNLPSAMAIAAAFQSTEDLLRDAAVGNEDSADDLAEMQHTMLHLEGLSTTGQVTPGAAASDAVQQVPDRFVIGEVIALYW